MLQLKRLESFCASHRLFNPNWSNEENYRVFGKCSHANGHGHNYKLEVCVQGEIDSETGMVFNLQTLKEIIQNNILEDVDHKHLNFDVPWLQGKIPTTEILVDAIWQRLNTVFHSLNTKAHLYSVTLWETEKNIATKSK